VLGTGLVAYLNDEGCLVDQQRLIYHPALDEYYVYEKNPDSTKNMIYAATPRMETTIQRTLGSTLAAQSLQKDEDIFVQEIWVGGGGEASVSTEQFRALYRFWTTPLPAGEFIGWAPLDISTYRYNVRIVNLQLGSGAEIDYHREIRTNVFEADDAYIAQPLVMTLKLERAPVLPRATISLEGI